MLYTANSSIGIPLHRTEAQHRPCTTDSCSIDYQMDTDMGIKFLMEACSLLCVVEL